MTNKIKHCEFCGRKHYNSAVTFEFWELGIDKRGSYKELLIKLVERANLKLNKICEKWCSMTSYSPRTFYDWYKSCKSQKIQSVTNHHLIFYCCNDCLKILEGYNLEKDKEKFYEMLKMYIIYDKNNN